ncbi:hypothetical protein BV25DRAFT_1583522 [Artomyces pyxidatus]|uniref:Uncharacterized protein n=1 Tax=Artomyces pyxidatus TaxID=48021 RepID=A0ACB8TBI0_9AGAM|nr:hypothetical protein BV25DRAFT_1583522 [Artomyces pyxidatus]
MVSHLKTANMKHPQCLPIELFYLIADFACREALFSMRSVDRFLCKVATPRAFRVLLWRDSPESVSSLCQLLCCRHLRGIVEEIICCRDKQTQNLSDDRHVHDTQLLLAFSLFRCLPALRALSIDLLSCCGAFQRDVIAFLSISPPLTPLRALSLHNISPWSEGFDLDPLSRGLAQLSISIATHRPPADVPFWAGFVPRLLQAPANTLTSLALHTGDAPPHQLNLRGLFYPHLRRLSLGCIFLDKPAGAEEFILAHAQTLVSLRLRDCKIKPTSEIPGRTWGHVYGVLGERMECLRELDVTNEGDGVAYCPRAVHVPTILPEFGGWPLWKAWDARELEKLKEIVRVRAADVDKDGRVGWGSWADAASPAF